MAEALDDGHAFAGRVAVVTGAGRGIGRGIAVSLAARGAAIVVVARLGTELAGAVDDGIVARPGTMRGGTTYTATKGAIEAHSVTWLHRPGTVDTGMQAHIRDHDPERVGGGLVQLFQAMSESGSLVTPEESARDLVARLSGVGTGDVWSFGV